MEDKSCWYCLETLDTDDLTTICQSCGSEQNFTEYKPTEPPKEEEGKMGKLLDRAREKSPYIMLSIGEETPVLIYKSWKEVTDNFGNEAFRYIFELQTENGAVTKQLDNRSQSFAEAMDKINFGEKVIVSREQKLDHEGGIVENKSIWTVRKAE